MPRKLTPGQLAARKKRKHKLYMRKYRRETARIRSLWHRLRSHAKERNKTCGISLEDFTEWCRKTNYHNECGRGRYCASIDRDDNDIGYEKGNLVKRSVSDNIMKENYRRVGKEWKPVDCDWF